LLPPRAIRGSGWCLLVGRLGPTAKRRQAARFGERPDAPNRVRPDVQRGRPVPSIRATYPTGLGAAALRHRAALPPVDDLVVFSQLLQMGRDQLDVPAATRAPAELPQLAGGTLITVQYLIHVVGIYRASTPAIDRRRDVPYQLVQARLMVGSHLLASGAPRSLV